MTHSPGEGAHLQGKEKGLDGGAERQGTSGRFRARGTARVRQKKALTFTLTCGKQGHRAGSGLNGYQAARRYPLNMYRRAASQAPV